MFGSLFGVRNFAHFRPIAPERDFPEDASELVKEDFAASSEDNFSPTWITWNEIKAINWEEAVEVEPYQMRYFIKLKDGRMSWAQTTYPRAHLAQKLGLSEAALDSAWKHGQVFEIDGKRYEAVKFIKRKDSLTKGWQTLFKLMEVLAEEYGADGVRLIAWFD